MDVTIRPLVDADIEFGLVQTGREGWDPTVELFRVWLAHDAAGDFVAEIAGRPVGLVTTTCYARTAWIGNLIVVPEHRRQGIGRTLMKRALAHLASRLSSAPIEPFDPSLPSGWPRGRKGVA